MNDRAKISLAQQIEEVAYELAQRATVYPRIRSSSPRRGGELDYHMARMQAVLATLRWLQKNEAALKQADELQAAAERLQEENEALRARLAGATKPEQQEQPP